MKTEEKLQALRTVLATVGAFQIPIEQAEEAAATITGPLKAVITALTEEREAEVKKEIKRIKRLQKKDEEIKLTLTHNDNKHSSSVTNGSVI